MTNPAEYIHDVYMCEIETIAAQKCDEVSACTLSN